MGSARSGIRRERGLRLAILAACGALVAARAVAQNDAPLFLQPIYGGGSYFTAFAVGDFDGDGKPDVVWRQNSGQIEILLGKGNGTFMSHGVVGAAGSGAESLAVADFDGDGHADLLTGDFGGNSVSSLLGDGTGDFEFGAKLILSVYAQPSGFALDDFDADGIADAAVLSAPDQVISLHGAGDGTFVVKNSTKVNTDLTAAATGDFNEDGRPDVAVACQGSEAKSFVSILRSEPDGSFTKIGTKASGHLPFAIATGDLDGDGHLDLVTANYGSDSISRLLGDGTGKFTSAGTIDAGLTYPLSLALQDLNADGDPDLAVVGEFGPGVSVMLGEAGADFSASVSWPNSSGQGLVKAVDLDGDGNVDLLSENSDYATPITALRGLGDGSFATNEHCELGDHPGGLAVGDFDADGLPDLVTASLGADLKSGTLSIVLARADGQLVVHATLGLPFVPGSVATGDLNADGHVDLAVADDSHNIRSLLGAGPAHFIDAGTFPVGEHPSGIALADLDGDGTLDVAVANNWGGSASVLLGTGDGGFASAGEFAVGLYPSSVAVGDFDRDGNPDLALQNYGSDNVSILMGQGNGGFTPRGTIDVAPYPDGVAVGDFDRDGIPDLASVNHGYYPNEGSVSILSGLGNGSFAETASIPVAGPASIALGDFDGDGNQDLACGGDRVSILMGDGSGGFSSPESFFRGGSAIVVEDFNADGRQDLAMVEFTSIGLLLNQGVATWTDLGFALPGAGGSPWLVGIGSLAPDAPNRLHLTHASPQSLAALFCGLSEADLPFKGGTLVPAPEVVLPQLTDAAGSITLDFHVPAGLPSGLALTCQLWVQDPGAMQGVAASNAVRGVTP